MHMHMRLQMYVYMYVCSLSVCVSVCLYVCMYVYKQHCIVLLLHEGLCCQATWPALGRAIVFGFPDSQTAVAARALSAKNDDRNTRNDRNRHLHDSSTKNYNDHKGRTMILKTIRIEWLHSPKCSKGLHVARLNFNCKPYAPPGRASSDEKTCDDSGGSSFVTQADHLHS